MPEALFLFVQLEYPWLLGPPDGRYLLRADPDADPERVVVLGTLGAQRSGPAGRRPALPRRPGARAALRAATAEPAPVSTTRATIVDPVPLSAERQAQAWLDGLDPEHEADAAVALLNRVLESHRISAADPHVHEVSAEQALVIRVGWGAGEQVADGRWLHARELPRPADGARGSRRAARRAALGHELRFARLLGGHEQTLVCEELALRARADLDGERLRHAAIGLDRAIAIALHELAGEQRNDLAVRLAELEQLHAGVAREAELALSSEVDRDVVAHALGRLEAALRARAAH